MRILPPLLAIGTAACIAALTFQAPAEKPALKALYITGGGFHDYDGQKIIITETLAANIPNLEITVAAVESSREAPVAHPIFEKEGWADGYDVVIYNMCNSADSKDAELIERIVAPHREGTPAVVIHCTMHCFRPDETGKWNAFVGIETTNHERHAPMKVTFDGGDHPILKGLPETWEYERGELYRVISAGDNVVHLATGISSEEKEHTVVWTNTYGEGRVFGTTIGHATETMAEQTFQDLLTNGVRWALDIADTE
jgi:uncharacterized protein